ncbi:hydrolase [Cytobacillus depressus]|uniref:Hydrolase n=1 Tax=Cytobacillus depressus TaxID=1602942 RepID=A0A6L3VBF1_9BACI|nr:hydrolase [Cytobacillus depressus]KAB2338910.1 hydrolase [Cytobacillus depressus]
MSENKKTYYIKVETGEITQSTTDSAWDFKIEATDEEITSLREYFDHNYSNEWKSFVRAHIPFMEYHNDKDNDAYDKTIKKVYGMIYELGDEEARSHIESMGILDGDENQNF